MTSRDITNDIEYNLPNDWRGEVLSKIRILIKEADPEVIEEVKWRKPSNPDGNLVWSHDGMISTGEIYKEHIRMTLGKGQLLKEHDPKSIINAHRAIIIRQEDKIDESAFKDLIRAAVQLNTKGKNK